MKLEKSLQAIQKVRESHPDLVNAYLNFTGKVKQAPAIREKQKALILVSLSMMAQCEMCIESNVEAAISVGASKGEIIEAAMLAVSMGGGPKMMYLQYVMSVLES